MSTLKKDLQKFFSTDNLYGLFNIPKTAKEDDLKRAYRKLSLTVHPDRVPEADKETATAKFQVVGKAYAILSDKSKRKIYDKSGVLDDELVSDAGRDWYAFYREMFPEITKEDIDGYLQKYVGSEEEHSDLLTYYERFKGDMDKIMECMMGYDFKREDQYHRIIDQAIKDKKVADYKIFTKEDPKKKERRRKRLENEARKVDKIHKKQEAEKAGGDAGMSELEKMILARQEARGVELNGIVDKYAKKDTKKNKNPPSDDESSDDGELLSGDACESSDDGKQKKKATKAKKTTKANPPRAAKATTSKATTSKATTSRALPRKRHRQI